MHLSVKIFNQRSGEMDEEDEEEQASQRSAGDYEEEEEDEGHMSTAGTVDTETDDAAVVAATTNDSADDPSMHAVGRSPKPSCCTQMERDYKTFYSFFGGLVSSKGDSGLDGTGTIGATHKLIEILILLCGLSASSTFTDFGSGLGLFLVHVCLATGATSIGFDNNDNRVKQSICQLTKLGAMVNTNPNLTLTLTQLISLFIFFHFSSWHVPQ